MPPKSQEWGHHLFQEHPLVGIQPKHPLAWCDSNLARKRVFCRQCYTAASQFEINKDNNDFQSGNLAALRHESIIETHLWSSGNQYWKPTVGRIENILRHIKYCAFSAPEEKAEAERRMQTKSYMRVQQESPTRSQPFNSGIQTLGFGAGTGLQPLVFNTLSPLETQAGLYTPTRISNLGSSSSSTIFPPSHSPSIASPLFIPSASYTPPGSTGSASPASLSHSASPLMLPPDLLFAPASKRARRSLSRQTSLINVGSPATWSDEDQQKLAIMLARITVSCGFPYRWVENPEVVLFMGTYFPAALPISCRQISDRYIPQEVSRIRAISINDAKDKLATLQLDGWGAINFHHFIAFMITTDDRRIYTVKVYDTSADRKTADKLMELIREVRLILQRDWKVKVVAITTDASGETKKARSLCIRADPALIAPDCWAHQNALVVGDYMRVCASSSLLSYADIANDIITWLRSKSQLLAIMRNIQSSAAGAGRKVLSVIRPVATRWTTYFLAYQRLAQLLWVLKVMVHNSDYRERMLAGKSAAIRAKNAKMVDAIETLEFGVNLTKIIKHLEPLARSSCILQAAHARLDQVPLVFGTLLMEYAKLKQDPGLSNTTEQIEVIESSIERRWKACDQSIYIAAIILHPLIRAKPFRAYSDNSEAVVSRIDMCQLIKRLWERFYPDEPRDTTLWEQFEQYLENEGRFSGMESYAMHVKDMANRQGIEADPIHMWRAMNGPQNSAVLPLHKLAKHIFSVCCNSASCERLFSMFGLILTKLRSRLQGEKMTQTAELRLHLRDEHIANGTLGPSERLKRKTTSHGFDSVRTTNSPAVGGTPASIPSQSPTVNPPVVTTDTVSDEDQDLNDFIDEEGLGSNTSVARSRTFRLIVDEMSQAASDAEIEDIVEGNTDALPVRVPDSTPATARPPAPPTSTVTGTILTKIPLASLFDFKNEYWEEIGKHSNTRSLQDELELHELLDKDLEDDPAGGEDDNDAFYASL